MKKKNSILILNDRKERSSIYRDIFSETGKAAYLNCVKKLKGIYF